MTRPAKSSIIEIAQQFQLEGHIRDVLLHGSGHIHDTYLLVMDGDKKKQGKPLSYILQCINNPVFPDPPGVMENIVRVTAHIRGKLANLDLAPGEIERRVLTVISTQENASYCQDNQGHYWRVYRYIEASTSYNELPSANDGYTIAKKFGEFLQMLHDLPGPPLHDTIKNFHNGPVRYSDFESAVERDVCNRAREVKPEIDFLFKQGSIFSQVRTMIQNQDLPLRVTHNDTKVNNILVDETTHEALCVIDLDTVMTGVSLYDFGDLARTTLSMTPEDELDISKVSVDREVFKAISSGFLQGAGTILTLSERQLLITGAKYMTLLIGMRFLTDYLKGDTYFRIHHPSHNLERARRQLALVRSIIAVEDELNHDLQQINYASDDQEPFQ